VVFPVEKEKKYRRYWVEIDRMIQEVCSRVKWLLEEMLREFRADFGELIDKVAKELGVEYKFSVEYDKDNPALCRIVMYVEDGEDAIEELRARLGDILDAARIVIKRKERYAEIELDE